MRIVVSRVIYDDEIQECVYGPEDGVEPRGELHVILDRKIFWAVKTLESFEKQQLGEEEETEEVEIAAPRKRLSAYEKVMAKYGSPSFLGATSHGSSQTPGMLPKALTFMLVAAGPSPPCTETRFDVF